MGRLLLVAFVCCVAVVVLFLLVMKFVSDAIYDGFSFILLISAVLGGAGYKIRKRGKS